MSAELQIHPEPLFQYCSIASHLPFTSLCSDSVKNRARHTALTERYRKWFSRVFLAQCWFYGQLITALSAFFICVIVRCKIGDFWFHLAGIRRFLHELKFDLGPVQTISFVFCMIFCLCSPIRLKVLHPLTKLRHFQISGVPTGGRVAPGGTPEGAAFGRIKKRKIKKLKRRPRKTKWKRQYLLIQYLPPNAFTV